MNRRPILGNLKFVTNTNRFNIRRTSQRKYEARSYKLHSYMLRMTMVIFSSFHGFESSADLGNNISWLDDFNRKVISASACSQSSYE